MFNWKTKLVVKDYWCNCFWFKYNNNQLYYDNFAALREVWTSMNFKTSIDIITNVDTNGIITANDINKLSSHRKNKQKRTIIFHDASHFCKGIFDQNEEKATYISFFRLICTTFLTFYGVRAICSRLDSITAP